MQILFSYEEEIFILHSEHPLAVRDAECSTTISVSCSPIGWRESVARCHCAAVFHCVSVDGFGQHATNLHQCSRHGWDFLQFSHFICESRAVLPGIVETITNIINARKEMREGNVFSDVCLFVFRATDWPLPQVVQSCSLGDTSSQRFPLITIHHPPPPQTGWKVVNCSSTERPSF